MHSVNYVQTHAYTVNSTMSGSTLKRPWIEVIVRTGSSQRRVWCLVDTGADDVMLDLGVAAMLGIPYQQLPQVPLQTANGPVSYYLDQSLTLEFAGQPVTADVLFGVLSVPLLGRAALLAAVEAGFDANAWHHS